MFNRYLPYTQQLVLHMNVDGKSSTKSKTLHRRANDLKSTLAQNIDELKNEMKDGKKESPSFGLHLQETKA